VRERRGLRFGFGVFAGGFHRAARGIVYIAVERLVLFLGGDLTVHVIAARDFVFAGVRGRQLRSVPERFVFHAAVGQPVRFIVGVVLDGAAFGGAFPC
jgi:hypothetical protein